jgi:hypothetical protein
MNDITQLSSDKQHTAYSAPPAPRQGQKGHAPPNLDGLKLEDGEDAIAAPKNVLDDIASLVISPEETVLAGTREIVTNVAVRKPKKR